MIFTLDDGAEDMDRESLNNGITAVLDALNHAHGTLQDVIVPVGQVFAWSCLLIFSFFIYFYFLITYLFSSLLLLVAKRNPGSCANIRKSGTTSLMRHGYTGT